MSLVIPLLVSLANAVGPAFTSILALPFLSSPESLSIISHLSLILVFHLCFKYTEYTAMLAPVSPVSSVFAIGGGNGCGGERHLWHDQGLGSNLAILAVWWDTS